MRSRHPMILSGIHTVGVGQGRLLLHLLDFFSPQSRSHC